MCTEETVTVFTCKAKDTLLKLNGSQSWKLNRKKVLKCKYLICTNNAKHGLSENRVSHVQAFLVGKISGVRESFDTISNNRWIIEFDSFADINIPNFWKGWRNPVRYLKNSEISINFEELEFFPVQNRDMDFIAELDKKERKYHKLPPLSTADPTREPDPKN